MCRFFSIILLLPTLSWGQINESFDDGNFTEAPTWQGQIDHFIVNSEHQLQLMAPEGIDESWLFTSSSSMEQAEWSFSVQLQFNPSSNNYACIYLAADEADPASIHQAIYLEMGRTNDAVSLYALDHGTPRLLISSPDKRLDRSSINLQVNINREGNHWTLRTNMGEGWQEEGQANYAPHFTSAYFGLLCRFTPTRSDKFFFDDIVVTGLPYTDHTPPKLVSHEALNGSHMLLHFSEAIQMSPVQTNWFHLSEENRYPAEITNQENDQRLILHYNPGLPNLINAPLHIHNLSDMYDNRLPDTTIFVSYTRVALKNVRLTAANQLQITFSKNLSSDFSDALISLSPGSFTSTISLESEQSIQVRLSSALQPEVPYTLTLNRFQDLSGDTIAPTSHPLFHYEPQTFDVILSELMVDPSPSAGLPDTEYIELYNRSPYSLDMSDWQLIINNQPLILPNCTIQSEGYLLLTPPDLPLEWSDQSHFCAMNSWRNLTNEDGQIALITSQDHVMDALKYNRNSWGDNTFKDNGGWSFECIDPSNRSASFLNWAYSVELTGGTPGYTNSIRALNPDTQSPQIEAIEFKDSYSVLLHFSEPMDFLTPPLQNLFELKNQTATIQKVHYDTLFLDRCTLLLANELHPNTIHSIHQSTLTDLAHNQLQVLPTHRFGRPSQMDSSDVIFNEVLFNPKANGADFIELYNRSQDIIDLSQLHLGLSNAAHEILQLYPISSARQCLFPGDFLTITPAPVIVNEQYRCEQPEWLLQVSPFPNLPNEEGHIALCLANGSVADFLYYHESMHFALFNDVEGISLERLSPNAPTNHPDNWHSAAAQTGYGTPTAINSQNVPDKIINNGSITLHPEIFTPNSDGTDDQLIIRYQFQEPGTVSTALVFNAHGHPVKHLYNNQLCGLTGFNTWDGTDDSGRKVSPGIYIVLVETFSSSGNRQQFKETCVLSLPSNN
jgi:hypothetical protein